jgi:hypothetical protein
MRFIRKNGRIIPVRDKGEKSSNSGGRNIPGDYKKTAAIGAIGGFASSAALTISKSGVSKPPFAAAGLGLGVAGALAGIAGQGYSAYKGLREYDRTKSVTSGAKEFLKHSFTLGAGSVAGFGAFVGARAAQVHGVPALSKLIKRRHLKVIK